MIRARVGAGMDPRVGGRAGGEDGEREHQQRAGPGEQPERERWKAMARHAWAHHLDRGGFVKREVP